MNKILLISCFVLSSVIYAEVGKVTGGMPHTIPGWFKNSFLEIQDDIDEATEEGKHLMLFMHLDNCPYCAKMVEVFNQNQELISKDFHVIAINIKGSRDVFINAEQVLTEKELAEAVKVKYTPTIIFLNEENTVVGRTNGYREFSDFKHMLDFIKNKHYLQTTFTQYRQSLDKANQVYSLKDNELFQDITDLSSVKKPLMLIFEDVNCVSCQEFHQTKLQNPDILAEMKKYTVVKYDANSSIQITTPQGKKQSVKDFVKELELFYRPGIVLFDDNKEINRIDGFLYTYHFATMLRFIGDGYYKKFEDYGAYSRFRTEELINQGIDINLVE